MAIGTEAAAVVDTIKERIVPALDTFDQTIRQGRRVVARGRYAAEDTGAAAALAIRRRPLAAVMIGSAGGALAGALLGFALGRLARCTD